jgi:energy-coupling factor transporter ATP-binding protein EcfA2
MISGIEIENFTAFGNLDIPLSPRINVIIGSNGTGKTHLLKAIYALAIASQPASAVEGSERDANAQLTNKLLRVFSPGESRIGALRARGTSGGAMLCLKGSDDTRVAISFNSNSRGVQVEKDARSEAQSRPVFIPTKEVLSLVRAMQDETHDRATVEMIFDDTYLDLAALLANPGFEDEAATLSADPRLSNIVRELVALVGGRYRWTNDGGFQFEPGVYEERADPGRSRAKTAQMYQDSTVLRFASKGGEPLSSAMTAEGYRKIGVLNRLLCNGSINPGSTGILLWDEPEANLNPALMKEVVQVLLELSRNGQQIILATHDYVLLKWFDLLSDEGKEDHIRYHVIAEEAGDQSISVQSIDDYSRIAETGISQTFSDLYDAEIDRSLEGVKL